MLNLTNVRGIGAAAHRRAAGRARRGRNAAPGALGAAAHTLTASTIDPLVAAVAPPGLEIQGYPGGELGAGPLEQYVRAVHRCGRYRLGPAGLYLVAVPAHDDLGTAGRAARLGMTGYDMIWNAYDAGLLADEFPAPCRWRCGLSEPNVFIMRDHDIRTPADLAG